MATHVAALIRVSSVVDQFIGLGQTENAIRTTLGPVRLPEGPYAPLNMKIVKTQAHSHDVNWGMVVVTGDLRDCNESDSVLEYSASTE